MLSSQSELFFQEQEKQEGEQINKTINKKEMIINPS